MTSTWFNGEFQDDAQISLSAFDHPVLRGDGIFESTRTEGSQIFFLNRHLERLLGSAEIMEMPKPHSRELLETAQEVVSHSKMEGRGVLRICLFSNGDLLITHKAISSDPEPVKLVIFPEPQYSLSRLHTAKTISYARSAAALRWAKKHDADEVVFVDEQGLVLETALANLVVDLTGELVTPPISLGGLAGITRRLVLDWFPEVTERAISTIELKSASGILVLSGVRFIRAATSLDGRELQNTQKMQTLASGFEIRAQANPNY